MSARRDILARLARAKPAVSRDYVAKPDNFTEQPECDPLVRFTELAEAASSTVTHVADWAVVPQVAATYLHDHGLVAEAFLAAEAPIAAADWEAAGISVLPPPLSADGCVLIGDSLGAVAENGTVVVSSAGQQAISDAFLAQTHIVLLRRGRIFVGLADLWAALRAEAGECFMPREFCLVSGPSRTADLGVPAKMGAHGPARVHVIVVAD